MRTYIIGMCRMANSMGRQTAKRATDRFPLFLAVPAICRCALSNARPNRWTSARVRVSTMAEKVQERDTEP